MDAIQEVTEPGEPLAQQLENEKADVVADALEAAGITYTPKEEWGRVHSRIPRDAMKARKAKRKRQKASRRKNRSKK